MNKRIERQTLHLYLEGELDMKNASELKSVIDLDIEKKGVRTVILHLDDLHFIDSSGLGVILGRYKKLLPLEGKLKIANAPPHIYRIMELSGLPKIIEFLPKEPAV
ncbi:Anti-sigma F factor antagonist (spoIIAA-2) [Dehalobacter sp. UNSWDHB]|jgi:anti-anti-sigma factor|uniref:STAS domain-containing protein n=1 Tax=unclassified Dehalobacter TaxID=2635733 RepID=UPI00028A7EE4|nr:MULTISPECIES: anti-sigma factor antagonist [unclassified Dehalobacter]AFV01513.1 Anti-sigma F factor antagonist (spoIIAA-2); Anti-sigma B factor antagonist RsbV [Dehalobacter sp. DCA]AFV04547.1 anti-sigma F factor antagonist (spoIIAA-2); anti sigma b factor antagonist RsbV [Dehalobacter sp. CF]EQB21220.1 Anti-sigma F factor antagonist (spoIIAA-2) [Dehalobacter sp. UNSWDHB]